MADQTKEKPFYLRVKFAYTVLAVGVFLTLALTGTAHFTETQVMIFILTVLGLNVAGHTTTDVAAVVASRSVFGGLPAAEVPSASTWAEYARGTPLEKPEPAPAPDEETDAEGD